MMDDKRYYGHSIAYVIVDDMDGPRRVDLGTGTMSMDWGVPDKLVEDEANRRFLVMDNLPKSKKPRPPGDHIQRGKAWGKKNRRNKWH